MDLYPHKSGLGLMEPVALINQNVGILWNNSWRFCKVTYLEPIPPFQFLNIGAVAAQTTAPKTAGTNLEVFDDMFAQFRWYPLDNAQVRLYLPNADGRYRLRNILSMVDQNILHRDPCLHLTEFFEWEDNEPWFEAVNLMDYPLAQCRLLAMGYRFEVKALDANTAKFCEQGTIPCVRIVCQGMGMAG